MPGYWLKKIVFLLLLLHIMILLSNGKSMSETDYEETTVVKVLHQVQQQMGVLLEKYTDIVGLVETMHDDDIIHFDRGLLQPNGYNVQVDNLKTACLQVKAEDPAAPSGVYHLRTHSGNRVVRAFCDMHTNGGGYTFLQPASLQLYSTADFSALVTDTSSAVVVFLEADNSVSYGVMKQLTQYSSEPLMVKLSTNPGYNRPVTRPLPYLYLGFLPRTIASSPDKTQQGLNINGQDLFFTNCDNNPNSYFAFFPDYEKEITRADKPWNGFCQTVLNAARTPASPHVFPAEYIMFAEAHWGGCGCLSMTNALPGTSGPRGAALSRVTHFREQPKLELIRRIQRSSF